MNIEQATIAISAGDLEHSVIDIRSNRIEHETHFLHVSFQQHRKHSQVKIQGATMLLPSFHPKSTACHKLFVHWRFSETSDPIVKIPKGIHSYTQKLTFDTLPNLKATKVTDD